MGSKDINKRAMRQTTSPVIQGNFEEMQEEHYSMGHCIKHEHRGTHSHEALSSATLYKIPPEAVFGGVTLIIYSGPNLS